MGLKCTVSMCWIPDFSSEAANRFKSTDIILFKLLIKLFYIFAMN